MKKSASMGCLSSVAASSAASNHPGSPSLDPHRDHGSGYASDDPTHGSCSSPSCRSERKKGIPWTEEEHKMFLVGLQKLGKGDWRGIARNFVVSRTPTQVASHAQKYFIRQTNTMRRKRRSSLFDMPMDEIPGLEEQFMLQSPPNEPESSNKLQPVHINPGQESKPKETSLENPPSEPQENTSFSTVPPAIPIYPAFYPAFVPVPLPFWPGSGVANPITEDQMGETHEVLKPTPVLLKDAINVDEVVSMSKLRIGESNASCMEPSALSLKLLGASSPRPSAFHINPSTAGPDLNQSKTNAIHAV